MPSTMEDIEDLILSEDYWDSTARMERNTIMPKVRRRKKILNSEQPTQVTQGNSGCGKQDCCQNRTDQQKENKQDQDSVKNVSDHALTLSNGVCASNDDHCTCSGDNTEEETANPENLCSSKDVNSLANGLSSSLLNGENGSNIPGLARIFVRTWGCSHNSSDTEYMAGQLASYGYDIVDEKQDAELWLLNSCTVKSPAEHHLRNEINAAHELGKKVVVAGCVSQGAPKSEFLAGLSIVGVQQIDRVVEVVEETLKGLSGRLSPAWSTGERIRLRAGRPGFESRCHHG
ncbi:Methylthiotransferase N-terminal [Trinorchestia longiramus]|nr:Methylthiotransferase N-terminal [Trinorchestia longiramus]